jgi:SAM-dependent methyltransferase
MNNPADKKALDCKSIIFNDPTNEYRRYELDVPYVPTPLSVVNKMLLIGNVDSADTVYDLGCGDGRIVVLAAKNFGATAFGFDLDSQKIQESTINAQRAGVTHKVSFFNKNIFDVSFSEATVVTLYLLTNINLRLRSKLFLELKPGSRVISHDFKMDTWSFDQFHSLDDHKIYLWIVPANFSGSWDWDMPNCFGSAHCTLQIQQRFQKACAHFLTPSGSIVYSLAIKGTLIEIYFCTYLKGHENSYRFRGYIVNNTINGFITTSGHPPMKFTANRDPSTIHSLL